MAQRSARREARPRAEADAGHRKRALLPLPARKTQRAFAISHGKRFVQREARPRAEADAGHRKRALLPLPARKTQRAFAISHGKRFVQREARSRAEADAGHRKRALLPLPARKPQTSIRHIAWQTNRAARAPSPCDRQCSTAARKRITTVILLPYHKQQTARRRPAPGCLLFFPIYKTELNQYNKVRSIKHRRRPS